MSSGLTARHVICQKMLGLWPIINSMSLLNLEAEARRERHPVGTWASQPIEAEGDPAFPHRTVAALQHGTWLPVISVLAVLLDKDAPPRGGPWPPQASGSLAPQPQPSAPTWEQTGQQP